MDLLERVVWWGVVALLVPLMFFGATLVWQEGRVLDTVFLLSYGAFLAFTVFMASERGESGPFMWMQWFVVTGVFVTSVALKILGH